jgi:hypothetical protein
MAVASFFLRYLALNSTTFYGTTFYGLNLHGSQ